MEQLFSFLGSQTGRYVRMAAGVILIVIGLFVVGGTGGWIIALIGLVPLAAGAFDFCVFAPLFGFPFQGTSLRKKLGGK